MTTTQRPPARGAVARLLEGPHDWGFFEETSTLYAARTGIRARRLVVFPPGTSAAERRALVLRRRWPTAGGIVALLAALVAAPVSSTAALAAMLTVYVSGCIVGVVSTRRIWRSRSELRCSSVRFAETWETYGEPLAVEESLAALLALERARDAGRIDEVGFELGWGRVYEAADARSRALE